jgi:hypothetical protein
MWAIRFPNHSSIKGLDDYYTGKTYVVTGEKYAIVGKLQEAKLYSTKPRAELAAKRLNDRIYYAHDYVIEEVK